MADALARRKAGGDKSPVGSVTQAQWFEFLETYEDHDERVKAATNARKDFRKKIEEALAGTPIAAFDQARKNRKMSGEIRDKIDAGYAQFMAWDRKPRGYAPELALGPDGKPLPLTAPEAARIDLEGLEAGKSKWNRSDNPYTPGQEEFARWDAAWLRGQAAIGASLTDDPAEKRRTLDVVEGGKGKGKTAAADKPPPDPTKPRRGRPPGGKKAAADQPQQPPGEQQPPGDGAGEQQQPQGDPPEPDAPRGEPAELEQEHPPGGDPAPDRYGLEWPSTGGHGQTH